MSDHSPEPWEVKEDMRFGKYITDSRGGRVYAWPFYITQEATALFHPDPCKQFNLSGSVLQHSDLHRIVACVNALAGVPDEVLAGSGVLTEVFACGSGIDVSKRGDEDHFDVDRVYATFEKAVAYCNRHQNDKYVLKVRKIPLGTDFRDWETVYKTELRAREPEENHDE